jgi:hypothetical protein
MKLIFSLVFSFATLLCLAQNNFNPQYGIKVSVGPATYYNPSISNIGFAHDYKYGQSSQLGILARQQHNNWIFSSGLNYQYMIFAYRGVGLTYPTLPFYYQSYQSNSTQHLAQFQIGCARSFAHGFELGLNLMPTFLVVSTDTYTIDEYWEGERVAALEKNAPEWHKAQLIGGLSFSKNFISKKEKTSQLSLTPQVSITNNGGSNVYNQAFSNQTDRKTRFVTCQLAYTLYF